jgi:RNA polymerase sigma-54 factor
VAQGLHLSQRLTVSQVLAPQMLQSLALLQAQTLELKALVEQELAQNPVLEEVGVEEQDAEQRSPAAEEAVREADPTEPPADISVDPTRESKEEGPVDDFEREFDKLVQLDEEWRNSLSQASGVSRSTPEDEEKRQFLFDSLTTGTSLQEALLEQLRLSDVAEADRPIGELLIGNIDDYGQLKTTVEELAANIGKPAEQILAVLRAIQTFDPPGVAARDLRECLMLQLERAGGTESVEYAILRDHFDALGKRRVPEICRGLELSPEAVQEAMQRIAQLEPRPGRAYLSDDNQYVVPEVFVRKVDDELVVTSNHETVPHLRISNVYKDLMARGENPPEVKNWIREKVRSGKFLIKSLHQRQATILNIAKEIVKRQQEFMNKGVAFLKPLTMQPIAEAVGVHETTVSRAVSGKYMDTPQGIFEMKYFFTGGLATADGASVSNTTVKEMVAEVFSKEDPTRPLSDQEVVKILRDKNIMIARRTVAKYRTELNILPSNLRKVYTSKSESPPAAPLASSQDIAETRPASADNSAAGITPELISQRLSPGGAEPVNGMESDPLRKPPESSNPAPTTIGLPPPNPPLA